MNHEKFESQPGEILRVEVGSTAHGIAVEGQDDLDLRAIVVEPPQALVVEGHNWRSRVLRSQPEGVRSGPGDIDLDIHPLRRFTALAAKGNPSMLLTFYAPLRSNDTYHIQKLAPHFWGQHVVQPFRGYMRAQCLRLLGLKGSGHGKRGGGRREELIAKHGYDTKYAAHAARLGFQCLEFLANKEIQLPMKDEAGDFCRAVRRGEVPFNDWLEKVLDLDKRLTWWEEYKKIRPGPDMDTISRRIWDIHMDYYGHNS